MRFPSIPIGALTFALFLLSPSIALAQGQWSELPPGERWIHASAFDPSANDMVVVTGITNEGTTNQVLRFELNGDPYWFEVSTGGSPPPLRYGASLVYDPNGHRMILFGGFGAGYLNDVWALDVTTDVWTQLLPAGMPPAVRGYHSAIYDPNHQRMVVFGGFNAGGYLNDTWALSMVGPPAWTPLTTAGMPPSARANHSAVYDGGTVRMLLFGGENGASLNDTWQLTLPVGAATPTWSLVPTVGVPPSARYAHTAIFDAANRRMVIFGGGNSYLNDVWVLPSATLQWTQLATLPSPGVGVPAGRNYHGAVYDPLNQRMVTFGGANQNFIFGDTWALPLSASPQWKALSPTPRLGPLVVLDAFRDRMMVFGGLGPTGAVMEDVWSYALFAPALWSQILPTGATPPARVLGSVIYDRAKDRFVLFGGFGAAEYNDVWTFSVGPPASWTQLLPAGVPPDPRYGHTAVYDEAHQRMLVFGGRTNAGAVDDHVWALSLSGPPAWTSYNGPGPSTRDGHVAVLDPVYWGDPTAAHMVVFGGANLGAALSDTWDWISSASPTWNSLAAGSPGDRYYSTAVYDQLRDRMLLFGGTSAGSPQNDLWHLPFYDTKAWSHQFPIGTPPQSREFSGGVYDRGSDRMLVFGGRNGTLYYDDLWQLDLTGVPVGVTDGSIADRLRMGPITPNPSSGEIHFALDLPQTSPVELAVYDIAGRLAYASHRSLSAGHHEVAWDGYEIGGARAAAGVYLARVKIGTRDLVRRFVLLAVR
jgi:hypothetical protein